MPSASSTRPPGNTHMPPKAWPEFLRTIRHSIPASLSRSRTTVAASSIGVSPRPPVRCWEDMGAGCQTSPSRALADLVAGGQRMAVGQQAGDLVDLLAAGPPAHDPPGVAEPIVTRGLHHPRAAESDPGGDAEVSPAGVVTVLPLTCPYPSPRAPILWDSRGITRRQSTPRRWSGADR